MKKTLLSTFALLAAMTVSGTAFAVTTPGFVGGFVDPTGGTTPTYSSVDVTTIALSSGGGVSFNNSGTAYSGYSHNPSTSVSFTQNTNSPGHHGSDTITGNSVVVAQSQGAVIQNTGGVVGSAYSGGAVYTSGNAAGTLNIGTSASGTNGGVTVNFNPVGH
jgi:hypothetical protein